MNKKLTENINNENAEVICAKIRQDAAEESETILKQARKEAEETISRAGREVQAKKNSIEQESQKAVQKSREKVMSSLNLEKKRLILGEKDKFVKAVLEEVSRLAEDFRKEPGYQGFLEAAVAEGAQVIEEPEIEVYYSYLDEHIFNEQFLKKLKASCSAAINKDCRIKLNKSDFKDPGVIVNSPGARISFDNRFPARLEREKDKIYMELLKGSF